MVGTVGRVLDLISRHSLLLHSCRYVVLDEADEMLDLGFLEDVEKILSLRPGGRQTALFSATMPPEIRALADRHLYDPVTVKVKAATLTIDTVEQFYVEVGAREKNDMLARVLEAERPDQAIVFVRTKIRCDQLYRTLRDRGHERQGAARRHEPGLPRRRDDRVQERPPADPRRHRRRRPRARHLRRSRTSSTSTSRPRPTSTCTASGAPAASAARAGRSRSSSRARSASSQAIEKPRQHDDRPVVGGRARSTPAPAVERPRRHSKPHDAERADERRRPYAKLIASGGRAAGLAEADIIHAVAAGAGLDGEAIRNVRVLERFALLEVPAREAVRVAGAVDGTEVRGQTLRLELARS